MNNENEVKKEVQTESSEVNNTNQEVQASNTVVHNVTIEVDKGGWYHDIFVAKNFKITRDDGVIIDFKPDTVEDGLVIPMFKPDGTPYYQLIDFDTLDYVIELFFQARLFKDRTMFGSPLPVQTQ